MSIKLIIISRYNNETFINNVKNYNLALPENTVVINPTDTSYEPVLIAQNLDTSNNNIIIYDWSVSQNTDPSGVIQDIIDKAFDFDLVYLGKFLDTCSKYTVSYTVGSGVNPPNIVKGTEPVGLNAALITPTFATSLKAYIEANPNKYYSINYVLNDMLIENVNLKFFAISSNLFVYDPMYNTIDLSQAYSVKTTECQPVSSQITPPSDNDLDLFWIIIIIIVVCIVLYLIINYTNFGKKKNDK